MKLSGCFGSQICANVCSVSPSRKNLHSLSSDAACEEKMTSYTTNHDTPLLQRVAAGDPVAFRLLFDGHRNRIYAIGLKLLKSEELAEDAVQEVFLKLWTNKEALPHINNFPAYLNTVTRHHLLNQLKRLAHVEKFVSQQKREATANNAASEALEWSELQAALSRAMNRLTPQQKKVYHLGKAEGLSYEEIAGQMQISRETVKSHMADALRSVKTYLRQCYPSLGRRLLTAFLLVKLFF